MRLCVTVIRKRGQLHLRSRRHACLTVNFVRLVHPVNFVISIYWFVTETQIVDPVGVSQTASMFGQ